jgi:hypothetical protein
MNPTCDAYAHTVCNLTQHGGLPSTGLSLGLILLRQIALDSIQRNKMLDRIRATGFHPYPKGESPEVVTWVRAESNELKEYTWEEVCDLSA